MCVGIDWLFPFCPHHIEQKLAQNSVNLPCVQSFRVVEKSNLYKKLSQ